MSIRISARGALLLVTALLVLAVADRAHAKVDRPVLKEFFQSGDKPTASQFATFIDSTLNFVDDRKLLGLKVYDPSREYLVGDTVVYNNSIAGSSVGDLTENGSSGAPQFEFAAVAGRNPNDPIRFDVATRFAGQYGFLGIKLEGPGGEINYGYIQMGMAAAGSPPEIHVDYIVYEPLPNTPIEVTAVPEPACLSLLGLGAIPLLKRRGRNN